MNAFLRAGFICAMALVLTLGRASAVTVVETSHVVGKITNITSTSYGLMLMVDGGKIPAMCTAASTASRWGWLLIQQKDEVMVSTVLSHWLAGRTNAAVYVSGVQGSQCIVNQYDP